MAKACGDGELLHQRATGRREAVEQILKYIEPWAARELLHLLVCPCCGGAAGRQLLDLQPDVLFASESGRADDLPRAEEPPKLRGTPVSELCSMSGKRLERWLSRSFEGVVNLEEAVRGLFDLCIALEGHPAMALKVSKRVRGLTDSLQGNGVETLRGRALAVYLNSMRLCDRAGAYDGSSAERFLRGEDPSVERGLVARAYGLACWEIGEVERAESLLNQAIEDLSRERQHAEEGVTSTLLGLLLEELGRIPEAITYLVAGLTSIVPSRSWLAARGTYQLALSLTALGDCGPAWRMLLAGKQLRQRVALPADIVMLDWLEGAIGVRLEGSDAASKLLERAARRLAQDGRAGEALLAACDLGLALSAAGRGDEVGLAVSGIERLIKDRRALDRALPALRGDWTGPYTLEEKTAARRRMLLELRTWGPRPRPLQVSAWIGASE